VAGEVTRALATERFSLPDLAVSCALLHDCLEDTTTTEEKIRDAFDEAVLAGVKALTKDKHRSQEERMLDSRRIRQQPREVWIVKLADRITNLQPPPSDWGIDKIRAYRAEAFTILEALGEASPFLALRMSQKLTDYSRFRN
jgi:(p)ppGpp synthase/HD superfamily hydrolase